MTLWFPSPYVSQPYTGSTAVAVCMNCMNEKRLLHVYVQKRKLPSEVLCEVSCSYLLVKCVFFAALLGALGLRGKCSTHWATFPILLPITFSCTEPWSRALIASKEVTVEACHWYELCCFSLLTLALNEPLQLPADRFRKC